MGVRSKSILRRERMEIFVSKLIDLFVAEKQSEGCSPKTTQWYEQKLKQFDRFLSNGSPARLPDFTLENVRDYIAHLQGKDTRFGGHSFHPEEKGGLSSHTIHGHVRTLKVFSGWLHEASFTNTNRLSKLKRPRLSKPMIDILSEEEIEKIFDVINPDCILGARMYATILLLLDTGIRATELCTLTLDNTHLDKDYIKVAGKGNKERIVPFGPTCRKALLRYVTTWRPYMDGDGLEDHLFVSADGGQLTYGALQQALKRLGKKAGVPRLRAHLFRHTFAVRYLINGGDLMTLRLMLGHTSIQVTQVYLHLADSHVQIQHHRFSPVERLGLGKRRRKRR